MASTLSPSAILRIITLVSNDDRRAPKRKKKQELDSVDHVLISVNGKWLTIYNLYVYIKPAPPLDYLNSLELALVLKGEVDEEDAFSELQREPTYIDVTITDDDGMRPSEAWPQIYSAHLPCYACTMVETLEERRHPRYSQSSVFHKVTIRLADKTCSAQGRLSGTANRSSATLLLLPDLASEVFGFFERVHIGSSLLANRDLRDRLCQLKQRLPRHHLTCFFGSEPWNSGAYWLTIRHFRRDLSYTDVRRFEVPSTAGAENDCALIRHYLNNSHLADLQPPKAGDFPFAIKMLASLAARNVTVGRLNLLPKAQRLFDYRSMESVFGGMRMSSFYVTCVERRFVELAKTTDVFRMSTFQGLRELKLSLTDTWNAGRAYSPFWVSGIYQLWNCQHYRVDYESKWTYDHLESIEREIVQICEEFERGNITNTVEHFEFRPSSCIEMNYAFSRDNLLVSEMKVEGKNSWDKINNFAWDVYRFRNTSTGGYLTACVGRRSSYSAIL